MVLIALLGAGCGGSGSSGGEGPGAASTTTGSNGPTAPADGHAADRRALEKISSNFGEIARTGDSKALCRLFEPQRLIEAMGSRRTCIQLMSAVTNPNPEIGEYIVDTITFRGNEAEVTYKNDYPTAVFEKIDGKWWARPPELPGRN